MPRGTDLVEYDYTLAWLRGLPAEVYFRTKRFLLAAPGFFSRFVDIRAFHQPLALWMQLRTATRPFTAIALFSYWFRSNFYMTHTSKPPPTLPIYFPLSSSSSLLFHP